MSGNHSTIASSTTGKPLYEAGTQFKNWRYSPEQLAHIRVKQNAAAVSVIRSTFEAHSPGSSSNLEFLTADEEHLLVKLYISRVTQLCGHFHFPEEVEATAISFLKRFYLTNTAMDWHPKNVMLTALFLATKTTNNPISLEAYTSNIPKTTPSDVLDLEFLVAQSLGFEFSVWHAHRALWGLWLDLQSLSDPSTQLSQEIYDDAVAYVRAARLTDAELIYTPSQIALACISLSCPTLSTQWLISKTTLDPAAMSTLQSTIDTLKSLITGTSQIPDVEFVRVVDRRLKLCKNPEKVVGSGAYRAKRAEEEKKMETKRSRKAEEVRRVMDNEEDPFGVQLREKVKAGLMVDDDDDDDDDD